MSKLIPLDEAKALLKSRLFNTETKEGGYVLALSPTIIDEFDTIHTIDPIEEIDEMIEENINYPYGDTQARVLGIVKNNALQELKSRLLNNK